MLKKNLFGKQHTFLNRIFSKYNSKQISDWKTPQLEKKDCIWAKYDLIGQIISAMGNSNRKKHYLGS